MTNTLLAALRKWCAAFGLLALTLSVPSVARAGLTLNLTFSHFTAFGGTYYYEFDCFATTTNATAPAAPYGNYLVVSPGYPASNEFSALFHYDSTNGWVPQGGGVNYLQDFSDIANRLTNGNWAIYVTNLNSTAVTIYNFTVSAPGLTSGSFSNVLVTFPTNNEADITTRSPIFTWEGPSAYDSITATAQSVTSSFYESASLPATQTNWPSPSTMPFGTNSFTAQYNKNATSTFAITTPKAGSSNISEWTYVVSFVDSYTSQFVIQPPPPTVGYTNLMHYTFDYASIPGLDYSSNEYNIECTSYWGSPQDTSSTNAVAGLARQFYGNSSLDVGCAFDSTWSAWTNVFGSSFSVSAWINTSVVAGNDQDTGLYYLDPALIDVEQNGQGTIPIGLTGTKLAFFTGDPDGNQDTLHSVTDVTTGKYVHVVVTRDIANGQKMIYINGSLDASDYATLENLTGNLASYTYPSESIGGVPNNSFTGLVDDVQIYSGILALSDVQYLYQHPGSLAIPLNFNAALDTTNLPWTTSGDRPWFVETTNTPGDVSAAQSGGITNNQTSTISVVVTGPGTLTFWWQNDGTGDFDLEFDMDGNYQDDIESGTYWYQDGPFSIPAGQHTLSWTANPYGDTDPTESGYLDMVNYLGPPTGVNLTSKGIVGSAYEFSFTSTSGHTNQVQYSTNLASPTWLPYTNIVGDGTVKTIMVPTNGATRKFFRVSTQ